MAPTLTPKIRKCKEHHFYLLWFCSNGFKKKVVYCLVCDWAIRTQYTSQITTPSTEIAFLLEWYVSIGKRNWWTYALVNIVGLQLFLCFWITEKAPMYFRIPKKGDKKISVKGINSELNHHSDCNLPFPYPLCSAMSVLFTYISN